MQLTGSGGGSDWAENELARFLAGAWWSEWNKVSGTKRVEQRRVVVNRGSQGCQLRWWWLPACWELGGKCGLQRGRKWDAIGTVGVVAERTTELRITFPLISPVSVACQEPSGWVCWKKQTMWLYSSAKLKGLNLGDPVILGRYLPLDSGAYLWKPSWFLPTSTYR